MNATRDEPIADNRGTRTIGSTIDDSLIETKAAVNIAKAHADLDQGSHIVVASYNGVRSVGRTNAAQRSQADGRAGGQFRAAREARP